MDEILEMIESYGSLREAVGYYSDDTPWQKQASDEAKAVFAKIQERLQVALSRPAP